MITDSYLKYNNSEFGSKNQGTYKTAMSYSDSNSSGSGNSSGGNSAGGTLSGPGGVAGYNDSSSIIKLDSFQKSILDSNRRRYTAEDSIIEILRGIYFKIQ
jgi:hypothetical protein